MTKEEALDIIIENYKNDDKYEQDDVRTAYCVVTECSDCVFRHGQDCTNTIAEALIDRLIKAEEKKETNLEHFRGNVIVDMPNSVVYFDLKNGWEESYSHHKDVIDWFLSPYEPPKYKLKQFEYDLLDFCKKCNDTFVIEDWAILRDMHDKGYFKGVPTDVPIRDILENCEVIDSETD